LCAVPRADLGGALGAEASPSKILPFIASLKASRSCSTDAIAFYTHVWAMKAKKE